LILGAGTLERVKKITFWPNIPSRCYGDGIKTGIEFRNGLYLMIRYGGPMLETQVAPISPEGAKSGADFFMGYLLRNARPQRKIGGPFTTPKDVRQTP